MGTEQQPERRIGLDLHISGACLLVSHPRRYLSILMPKGDHKKCHHDHGMPHRSVIVLDKKYVASSCPEDKPPNWCVIDISGKRLELTNGSPPSSLDLADAYMVNRFAPDRRAKKSFGDELQAEVKLASGECTGASVGARFRIDGRKMRMPHVIYWRIDNVATDLQLTLLNGEAADPISLVPGTDTRIAIYIRHVPENEVVPDIRDHTPPNPGTPSHHFFALDQLLVTSHVPIIEPVWEGALGDNPCDDDRRGGNPYTCMPGGTDPGDDGL